MLKLLFLEFLVFMRSIEDFGFFESLFVRMYFVDLVFIVKKVNKKYLKLDVYII